MKKISFLSITLFFFTNLLVAQPTWKWAKNGGLTSNEEASCIAVDTSGNSYIAGSFRDSISFDGNKIYSSGGLDVFLAKYNRYGDFVWVVSGGGSSDDNCYATEVNNKGEVYIAGDFGGSKSSSATFGTGGKAVTLNSAGNTDAFIVKYLSDGTLGFAKSMGDKGEEYAYGLAVDTTGDAYMTGSFSSSSISISLFSTLTLSGTVKDGYAVKIDRNGAWQYGIGLGGATSSQGNDIDVDKSGNIYLIGSFSDSLVLGTKTVVSRGLNDVFVAKANAIGKIKWYLSAGGPSEDFGNALKNDGSGGVYLTGNFMDSISFPDSTYKAKGGQDGFLARINTSGMIRWVQIVSGNGEEKGTAVTTNNSDFGYFSGHNSSNAALGSISLKNSGGTDFFTAKVDSSGNTNWITNAGGNDDDFALGIGISGDSDLYVAGGVGKGSGSSTNISFGKISLKTLGAEDIFIAHQSSCITPKVLIQNFGKSSVCSGDSVLLYFPNIAGGQKYQWLMNGAYVPNATNDTFFASKAANYSLRMEESSGCWGYSNDIMISILNKPTAMISNIDTNFCVGDSLKLEANKGISSGLTFQWQMNGSDINGATDSFYFAKSAATYTVKVSNGSCGATSSGVTLNQISKPNATISILKGKTTMCSVDTVWLKVTNPKTGNKYQWMLNGSDISGATDTLLTVTKAGKYSCMVGNSKCNATSSEITVTIVADPIGSFSVSNVSCTAILTASTNAGNTIQWYRGGSPISGATSTTYNATVQGDYSFEMTNTTGCKAFSASKIINIPGSVDKIEITTTDKKSYCTGDVISTKLQATTDTSFASYKWMLNGVVISGQTGSAYTATAGGKYSVMATNKGGCSKTSSDFIITINPLPAKPTISLTGKILTSSAANGNQWKLAGSNISGATAKTFTPTSSGKYSVMVTDSNGCSSTSDSFVYTLIGMDKNANSSITFTVYPNPFSSTITVELIGKTEDVSLCMEDLSGRKVFNSTCNSSNNTSFDLSGLPNGIYFLKISNQKFIQQIRVVKI